jgi:hypothetical protein
MDRLGKPEDKATVAQALLALVNHGGGYLIFGFIEKNDVMREVGTLRTLIQ